MAPRCCIRKAKLEVVARAAEKLIEDIDSTLDRMENWDAIQALREALAVLKVKEPD